jgi:streptomycin 6-kinase
MVRNPYDCFPQSISLKQVLETRIRVLKEELPFELYEIQGWAFAYTLMSTGWSVTDHGEVPREHIEIAETLDVIKI